jgi:hypothetical protein
VSAPVEEQDLVRVTDSQIIVNDTILKVDK